MDYDKKKEIIHKYGSTSFFYDDRYSKIQAEKYRLALKDILLSNDLIIDAGCGTGLLLDFISPFQARQDAPRCFYVGTDISLEMLKIFLSKIRKKGANVKRALNLVLSDMENLPFRNDVFHGMFSFTSLQNLPDFRRGMEECFRVSRNKANVVISILKKAKNFDVIKEILEKRADTLEIIKNRNLEDLIFKFSFQKKN